MRHGTVVNLSNEELGAIKKYLDGESPHKKIVLYLQILKFRHERKGYKEIVDKLHTGTQTIRNVILNYQQGGLNRLFVLPLPQLKTPAPAAKPDSAPLVSNDTRTFGIRLKRELVDAYAQACLKLQWYKNNEQMRLAIEKTMGEVIARANNLEATKVLNPD